MKRSRVFTLLAALAFLSACTDADRPVDADADIATIAGDGVLPRGAFIMNAAALPEMLEQCSRNVPESGTGSFRPTPADVARLEAALPAMIARQEQHIAADLAAAPTGWIRQYVGIQRGNQRTIYGNFAPTSAANPDYPPERHVISVCDGGPAFFGSEFDLGTGQIIHIAFNGIA